MRALLLLALLVGCRAAPPPPPAPSPTPIPTPAPPPSFTEHSAQVPWGDAPLALRVVASPRSRARAQAALGRSQNEVGRVRKLPRDAPELVAAEAAADAAGRAPKGDRLRRAYAVDRASDVLARAGLGNHLVDGGEGLLRVRGRAGNGPWRVAGAGGVITLGDQALADGTCTAIAPTAVQAAGASAAASLDESTEGIEVRCGERSTPGFPPVTTEP